MSIVVDPAFGFVGPSGTALVRSFKATEIEQASFGDVSARLRGKSENLSDVRWRAELAAAPWWLWWNILSLDAPLVACVWAEVFARCAGIRVPEGELATLFLSVWLIYTIDRLLDGRNADGEGMVGAFGGALRQRHIFHVVYRKLIAWVALAAAMCAGIFVIQQMNAGTFAAGFAMLCLVGAYMAWIHAGKAWKIGIAPKEFAVGMIFAVGASLPVWSRFEAMGLPILTAVVLFGVLCWLNCVAIDRWERPRDITHLQSRQRISCAISRVSVLACGIIVCACLAGIVDGGHGFMALTGAIACGAAAIAILDLNRDRLSAEGLRVLVDLALVIPPMAAMVVPFSR